MTIRNPKKIYGIKESQKNGLAPYFACDKDGRNVEINPKNPKKHSSFFQLQNSPHVFRNLGYVLANPDEIKENKSMAKKAVSRRATGHDVLYKKYDFYETIDDPNQSAFPHYSMNVAVFYGDDGNNFSLTYYDEPKGGDL